VQGLRKLIEKRAPFLPAMLIGRKEFFELIQDYDNGGELSSSAAGAATSG
jgi:hypothetical protein